MGTIQQALTRPILTGLGVAVGVKHMKDKEAKAAENAASAATEKTNTEKQLTTEDVYKHLMSTGATAGDVAKGFTKYRKAQKDNFRKRLDSKSEIKKEGDK